MNLIDVALSLRANIGPGKILSRLILKRNILAICEASSHSRPPQSKHSFRISSPKGPVTPRSFERFESLSPEKSSASAFSKSTILGKVDSLARVERTLSRLQL